MQFTQNESCGKCVLCREGTKQMLALLDDIIEGRADRHTLELLEQLAQAVRKGSLCGLGKTAPNPVLSTLRFFRAEVEAHVFQKRCPAGRCKALRRAGDPRRAVQRLHGLREEVPGRRDRRRAQAAAPDRSPRSASSAAPAPRLANSAPSLGV